MGKRGHGEGSIFRRKSDGRWVGSVSLGYADGKRKRKTVYAKTRKEVSDQVALVLRQHQIGTLVDDKQTLTQFVEHWLEHEVKLTRRGSTYDLYCSHMRRHILPILGARPLGKLTAQEVQAWVGHEVTAGAAKSTVRTMLVVLRTALSQAVKWQLVQRNVATYARAPQAPPTKVRVLTQDGARLLLDAAVGDPFEALYVLGLTIGLRMGETLGLRWQDVDFDERVLHVRMALQKTGRGLILGEPKTRASIRSIDMPVVLIAALRAHRLRQDHARSMAGLAWHATDLVFCRPDGRPHYPGKANDALAATVKRAGLPPMRHHDLRHSCVSLLADQGLPQQQAKDLMGHTSLDMTNGTYIHTYRSRRRDAAVLMDAILEGKREVS